MNYKETRYFFLEAYLEKEMGKTDAKRLYKRCSERLEGYLKKTQIPDNKAIKKHITESILPLIAIYKVLQEEGLSKEEAHAHCLAISKIHALRKKKSNESIGKNPIGFLLFKLFYKKVMSKNFPSEGWEVVWKERNRNKIAFEMHRCIYCEMTKAYGCPELCTVFCQNDVIAFAGFSPAIYFRRKGTLAEGYPMCDFNFLRNKEEV